MKSNHSIMHFDKTDAQNANYTLFAIDQTAVERQVAGQILRCNENIEQYGLILTEQQAFALAKTRTHSLKDARRIEFGSGIIDQLIMAFCDSPYITKDNYEGILHELINLFYDLKNNTWDRVSDHDLIEFLKTEFNHRCHGSIDLLMESAMQLANDIHCGKDMSSFQMKEK